MKQPPVVSKPSDVEQLGDSVPVGSTDREQYADGLSVFEVVWRFFCSTRLALILILTISVATLAGTLIMQAPAGVIGDAVEYGQWLSGARVKYGSLTNLLSATQLLYVFNSVWYRLLLAALTMNIVVCSVNRWSGIWRSISKPRVRMGERFFLKSRHQATFESDQGLRPATDAVSSVLSGQGYRVLTEGTDGKAYLYADKHRFGQLGTFFNHLSLVLILIGAIVGNIFGFHDRDFMVPVGTERAVGHGTNLTLRVDQFIDEYYPEGPPKDYRSDAVLLEDGKEVRRHTIRVNDPMEYDGLRFYQSFFGPAALLQVKDGAGSVLFSGGVPLAFQRNGRSLGSFVLPDSGLEVWVVAPVSGRSDPLVPAGQMRVEVYRSGLQAAEAVDNLVMGQAKTVGNLEFLFQREVQFTGLQVSRDPGTPIIWLGSAFLVIGLAMVFYFPHRRLWLLCKAVEGKGTSVTLGSSARRELGFDEEFDRVKGAMKSALAFAK